MKPRILFVLLSSVLLLSVLVIVEVRAQQGASKGTPPPSGWHVVDDALSLTKTTETAPAGNANTNLGIDSKQIENILGRAGKNNNGIYQFAIPRTEKVTEGGMPIPNSMGIATALNFQPTGNGKAAITGDFVLVGKEVNPVIKALRQNGIEVTALHSHMLDEQPRLFFMHFWANDDALKLAKGLRAAVDQTNSAKEKQTN